MAYATTYPLHNVKAEQGDLALFCEFHHDLFSTRSAFESPHKILSVHMQPDLVFVRCLQTVVLKNNGLSLKLGTVPFVQSANTRETYSLHLAPDLNMRITTSVLIGYNEMDSVGCQSQHKYFAYLLQRHCHFYVLSIRLISLLSRIIPFHILRINALAKMAGLTICVRIRIFRRRFLLICPLSPTKSLDLP